MAKAPSLRGFVVGPKSMHELIIQPQFGDVLDSETGNVTIPSDEEGDWMVMDDVVVERPILDIFGNQNILKRREATCKLIYGSVGRISNRYVRTTRLYAAVEDCIEEFYQGAFEDYDAGNFDLFGAQVMPLMEKGVATDIYSNKYFGDIRRASDPAGVWSWNKFDGVVTQISRYIVAGTIPTAQTFAIPEGTLTPAQADAALEAAFDRQDGIMKFWPKEDKVFYVDQDLAEAYHDYVVQSGQTTMTDRMSGKPILMKKGILIKPKKWDGILLALNGGTAAHVVILTVKGNFLYAADKTYGGGPRRNEAMRIWWSDDDNIWKRQAHLKASTEIIAPQHIVFGISEF